MRVNNVLLNKAKRSGFLTKVEVISRQAAGQEDYQVLVEDIISCKGDGEDIQFFQKNEILNHWKESYASLKSNAWAKLPHLPVTKSQILEMLSGNPSLSNGDDTFDFFDDFEGTGISASYPTGWTKSTSNPLKDFGASQAWFGGCYNDYDEKFYLYLQKQTGLDTQIQCYSFLKADAETPANWTDHGNVFTASESWENGWIEPHSVIWETQAMADAREGVGAGEGTQKWRLYYCAKPSGSSNYGTGFATMPETDMTNLTAYSGNPVYPHDASYTYPDCKAVVYNSEVWIVIGKYVGTTPNDAFFTHSSNGIDSWTDESDIGLKWLLGQPITVGDGMVTFKHENSDTELHEGYTEDGETITLYSSNPVMTGSGAGTYDQRIEWLAVAHTKDYTSKIDGYYYLWYIGLGADSSHHQMCLAKTQTVTQETIKSLDTNKWEVAHSDDGSHSITDGFLKLEIAALNSSEHNIKTLAPNFGAGHSIRFKERKEDRVDLWYTFAGMQNYIVYTGATTDAIALMNLKDTEEMRTYNEGAHTDTSISFDSTVWHTGELKWKSGEVKMYINDSLVATHTTNLPDESDLRPSLEIRTFGGSNPSSPKWSEYDWILVRKYATPEPFLIKRKISGKAGIIKSVCGGIAG